MRIAVCIKQVPDTEARLRLAGDGKWIDEDEVPFVINESDTYALEEALELAEKTGGEVVVVSLGPERVKEALRKGLALGAARAVHLADEAFHGGDAAATARALAAAVAKEEPDLVLTGSQSDDAGYGATGSILAGHLGWPHAWLVMGVELEDGGETAKVTREMESGMNEILRLRLPAVIEVQAGINHPRYASLKGIMQAKKKKIDQMALGDLGIDTGLTTTYSRFELPPARTGNCVFVETVDELVDKLHNEAKAL